MMEHEHDFRPFNSKGGYYKIINGKPEQRVAYEMLYCPRCGETKEVIVQNHFQ